MIKDTMHELLPVDLRFEADTTAAWGETESRQVMKSVFNPERLVARGAAEFAKRRLEAPVGCRETEACRKRRRQVENIQDYVAENLGGEL